MSHVNLSVCTGGQPWPWRQEAVWRGWCLGAGTAGRGHGQVHLRLHREPRGHRRPEAATAGPATPRPTPRHGPPNAPAASATTHNTKQWWGQELLAIYPSRAAAKLPWCKLEFCIKKFHRSYSLHIFDVFSTFLFIAKGLCKFKKPTVDWADI